MKDYIKRAQKNYMNKKKQEGWVRVSFFVPIEIKVKLLTTKREFMKEYYVTKNTNN